MTKKQLINNPDKLTWLELELAENLKPLKK
jgi:hypothetical protein